MRCRQIEDRNRRAAERGDGRELRDSGDLEAANAFVCRNADAIADAIVLVVSSLLVDRDLVVGRGPSAGREGERVEALIGAWIDAVRQRRRRWDDLPVPADELDVVGNRSTGRGDVRKLLHVCEHRLRECRRRRVGAVGVLEGDLAADHGVGVLVGLVDDLRVGAGDGVREDVRPADHRDAENDCERGEDGPELSSEHAFEGDGDHCASSSMTPSTACASERPRSRTMSPSARNRIRSAMAAARGSWVTITVVCP